MRLTFGRALSLLAVAASTTTVACGHGTSAALLIYVLFHVPCLALIWFAEELGSCTNIYVGRGGWVNTTSPPLLLAVAGWLGIAGIFAVFYFRS
jgi:hypothetical protein